MQSRHSLTGSEHKDPLRSGNPVRISFASDHFIPRRSYTGIPQLVEIPAPVMITTFFEDARTLAIFCNCRLSSLAISMMPILA